MNLFLIGGSIVGILAAVVLVLLLMLKNKNLQLQELSEQHDLALQLLESAKKDAAEAEKLQTQQQEIKCNELSKSASDFRNFFNSVRLRATAAYADSADKDNSKAS